MRFHRPDPCGRLFLLWLVPCCSTFFWLALLLCLLFSAPAHAWEGVVVRVIDGDTLLVVPTIAKQPEQATLSVRLYGIDAPELHHPGGQPSREALAHLLPPGTPVDITPVETDRYDRAVGLLFAAGLLVNLDQVRTGHATVYERYCRARFCAEWKREEKKNAH